MSSDALRELVAVIDFDFDLNPLKKMDKELDKVEKEITTLGGTIDKTGDKNKRMTRDGAKGFDKMSTSAGKSGKAYTDLGSKGGSALNTLKGAGGNAVSALADIIPKSGTAGLALSGMAVAGVAAGAAVVAALVGVSAAIIGVANDLDVMNDRMSAKMGATAEESADMMKSSLAVYKDGFGDSMESVQKSVGAIKADFRDLDGKELENVTKKVITMSDLFEKETPEINNAVRNMTKNFDGLSEGDALDLLTVGFQKGGSAADDLLDTAKEYSVYFAKLGQSPEQFIGTLIRGVEEGVYNMDFMADAVKELGIRSIDASKETNAAFEALGFNGADMGAKFAAGGDEANQALMATVAALSYVDDAQEQNAIGVQLWGTKWEDVREDAIFAMDGAEKAVEGFQGSTDRAAEQMRDNFSGKMNQISRLISGSFKEGVANAGISEWTTGVADNLLNDTVPALMDGMESMIGGLQSFYAENQESIDGFITGITTTFTAAWDIIQSIWGLIGPFLTSTISNAFALVMDVLNFAFTYIGDMFSIFSSLLQGDWSGAWESMKQLTSNALDGLIGIAKGLLELLFGAFDSTIGRILEAFWNIDLTEAGTNIINGLINGITSMKDAAVTAAKNVATGIWDSVTGFFDMHSPSRLMKGAGVHIVEGMNIGMEGMSDDAAQSALNVGQGVWDSFNGALDGDINPMVNVKRNVTDTFSQAVQSPVRDANTVAGDTLKPNSGTPLAVDVGGVVIHVNVERGSDGSAPSESSIAKSVKDAIEAYFQKLNIAAFG